MWLSFSPGAMNDINKMSTEAMVAAVAGSTKARYPLPVFTGRVGHQCIQHGP